MNSRPLVRVLVAGERAARFFDLPGFKAVPQSGAALTNGAGGLKDRDLTTDRAGRGFNPGGSGRHGMNGERSAHRHEIEQFARDLARIIEHGRVNHEFDRLVIMAGPRMLGLLRAALPARCLPAIAAQIPKDLVGYDDAEIRDVVPREVFFH